MILSDINTIIGSRFSYQTNYISSLLHRELGKSFSEILLSQRMERAVILLKGTSLAINEVTLMLGYRNSSHFYMAFREYYGVSPREYIQYLSKQYLLAYLYYRVAMKA